MRVTKFSREDRRKEWREEIFNQLNSFGNFVESDIDLCLKNFPQSDKLRDFSIGLFWSIYFSDICEFYLNEDQLGYINNYQNQFNNSEILSDKVQEKASIEFHLSTSLMVYEYRYGLSIPYIFNNRSIS
jgi:hypothetical protein